MTSTLEQTQKSVRIDKPVDLYLLDAARRMDEELNPSSEDEHRKSRRADRKNTLKTIKRDIAFGGAVLFACGVGAFYGIKAIEAANTKSVNNPNAIIHPYTVGNSPEDRMLSEIASDMHAFAPNQNYNDELPVIDTYVTPAEAKAGTALAGREIDFRIDTKAGILLPKLPANSANH